eukprot:g3396.t1
MRREARVLAALRGSDVPHPGFIAACEDLSVLGVVFYLMEPVDGFNPANGLPALHASDPAIRRRMGLSYIEGLAALGAVDYKSVGLEGFGKPDGFLERQSTRWMGQLESYRAFENWTGFEDLPDVEQIVTWLDAHRPDTFKPGIIHGDCHLANCMFETDGPELAAFVDWELSTIGDPLIDVGWVIATWEDSEDMGAAGIKPWAGFPELPELLAHYAERTDRNMDAIWWYGVLACFKLGAILEGTHARASAGKAPKAIGDNLHAMTINLFHRAHRIIADGSDLDGLHYHQVNAASAEAIEGYLPPFETLDVLVQSQGTVRYQQAEFEREGWDDVMDLNITSVMDIARKFKPMLASSKGSIVIVSSISGFSANIGNPAYAASKAAAISLTKTLGAAWARDGIRVNGLAPGLVPTKLTAVTTENEKRMEASLRSIPLRRAGTPEEMGKAALFLASPLASYVQGHTLVVDGGLTL